MAERVCECGHADNQHNWLDQDLVFCMFENVHGDVCGCLHWNEDEDESFYRTVVALEGGEPDPGPQASEEGGRGD